MDKHEADCNFAPQQCPGCKSQILKKNFEDHKNSCALFELICPECKLVYKRGNADTKHTENICLREQLRQMREESKKNKLEMQDLSRQLTELRSISKSTIDFNLQHDKETIYCFRSCAKTSIYNLC